MAQTSLTTMRRLLLHGLVAGSLLLLAACGQGGESGGASTPGASSPGKAPAVATGTPSTGGTGGSPSKTKP